MLQSSDSDGFTTKTGRIAISESPGPVEARAILLAARAAVGSAVTVDCRDAQHLHAAVLQILICLKREVESAGQRFVIVNVPPAVRRFLEVAGLSKVLEVESAR
jgi:anti-anti-sigma factor